LLTIHAAGRDIWDTEDSCYFVYLPLQGDGTITARLVSLEMLHEFTMAGVMIRESVRADAPNVTMLVCPDGKGTFLQARPAAGQPTVETKGPELVSPCWLKLVRRGNQFTGSASLDGKLYESVGSYQVTMGKNVLVGLAVASHVERRTTATVSDITIEK
jgi:hypothetical protein